MRRKVNSENFRKQSEAAEKSHFAMTALLHAYRTAHPAKIDIFMDLVTLHDPEHFKIWKELGEKEGLI